MKIMIISINKLSGRGGMEKVINKVYRGISSHGHDTSLLLRGGFISKNWLTGLNNYKILGDDRDTLLNKIKILLGMVSYIKSNKPDIIIATSPMAVFLSKIISRILYPEISVGSWVHFTLSVQKTRRLLKYADFHLAICNEIGNQIKKITPIQKHKNICTVYNPTNTDVNIIPRAKVPTFLYVGRLMIDGQKRVNDFLMGLSKLTGSWKATIIGDGPDVNKLKQMAIDLNISDKIEWNVGWKEDPWDEVDDASVLVLTSEFEGFGMVLVESLARGIPCISTECPTGPKEIIKPGKNGWLYPINDINKLAQLLQKVVDNPDAHLPDTIETIKTTKNFKNENVINKMLGAINQSTKL